MAPTSTSASPNSELTTPDPDELHSSPPSDMCALDFETDALASHSELPVYTAPPPVDKQSTLSIQQSPLASHPLPDLPPPPPSYKRSPSPPPPTTSQPSLHELPEYTPRAGPVSSAAPAATPTPSPNRWAAWNPLNWRNRRPRGEAERVRDPMGGRAGAELDACEQYEVTPRQLRDQREKDHSGWCCGGNFWAGSPETENHYVF